MEIDPVVVKYIKEETDRCVHEVFKTLAREDENEIAVIFPFWKLSNLAGGNIMDAEECRRSLNVIREWIKDFMEKLDSQSPPSDTKANQKSSYYKRFLQEQLDECDRIEGFL